jgi:hypothetical protein
MVRRTVVHTKAVAWQPLKKEMSVIVAMRKSAFFIFVWPPCTCLQACKQNAKDGL